MNQFKIIWINAPRQEYENKRNERSNTASHNKYSKIVLIVMNILLCNPPLTYSLTGISSSYEK